MHKNTSLYLDLIRFVAAFIVFLVHASNKHISGGLLWQVYPYGQTAVMIFFVLSGYVIAYVTDTREKSLAQYFQSRFSRVYSVLIPAIVLTLVCDTVGMSIDENSYREIVPTVEPNQTANYLLSLMLVQHVWDLTLEAGTNGPLWSLTYEAIYYALFGAIFFLKDLRKVVYGSILAILAGPSIVALFPIWLMGMFAYFVHKSNKFNPNQAVSIFISVATILLLIKFDPPIREQYLVSIPYLRKEVIADYFDGFIFCLHVLYMPYAISRLHLSTRLETAIRWLSSLTFVIYLFHYPLIRMLAVLGPENKINPLYWILLYGIPMIVFAVCTPYVDKFKIYLKNSISKKSYSISPT